MPTGWVFLGDLGRYVAASSKRFLSVQAPAGMPLGVSVVGVPSETLRVTALRPTRQGADSEWEVLTRDVVFGGNCTRQAAGALQERACILQVSFAP